MNTGTETADRRARRGRRALRFQVAGSSPAQRTARTSVLITPGEQGYPVRNLFRLSDARPVEVIGDRDGLCGRPAIALVTSRSIPGDLLLRTYDFMRRRSPAGPAFVSGFHSPMERQCLELLLARRVPVVVCPARSLKRMRVPRAWRSAMAEGRLVIVSRFLGTTRRPTRQLAAARNLFCASLADEVLVPYAAPGGHTERVVRRMAAEGVRLCTFGHPGTRTLVELGARLLDERSFGEDDRAIGHGSLDAPLFES